MDKRYGGKRRRERIAEERGKGVGRVVEVYEVYKIYEEENKSPR